jgi:hypothetical protein
VDYEEVASRIVTSGESSTLEEILRHRSDHFLELISKPYPRTLDQYKRDPDLLIDDVVRFLRCAEATAKLAGVPLDLEQCCKATRHGSGHHDQLTMKAEE